MYIGVLPQSYQHNEKLCDAGGCGVLNECHECKDLRGLR